VRVRDRGDSLPMPVPIRQKDSRWFRDTFCNKEERYCLGHHLSDVFANFRLPEMKDSRLPGVKDFGFEEKAEDRTAPAASAHHPPLFWINQMLAIKEWMDQGEPSVDVNSRQGTKKSADEGDDM